MMYLLEFLVSSLVLVATVNGEGGMFAPNANTLPRQVAAQRHMGPEYGNMIDHRLSGSVMINQNNEIGCGNLNGAAGENELVNCDHSNGKNGDSNVSTQNGMTGPSSAMFGPMDSFNTQDSFNPTTDKSGSFNDMSKDGGFFNGNGAGNSIGGGIMSMLSKLGRRRMMTQYGDMSVDRVCLRIMELVRRLPQIADVVQTPFRSNRQKVQEAANILMAQCQREAQFDWQMNQCTFYVTVAASMDVEMLEGAWLDAYGDLTEQHIGCGKVVTGVNAHMRRRAEVEVMRTPDVLVEGGAITNIESFVSVAPLDPQNHVFRRLASVASAGAIGAGVVLGHLCKRFDPATFEVLPRPA